MEAKERKRDGLEVSRRVVRDITAMSWWSRPARRESAE